MASIYVKSAPTEVDAPKSAQLRLLRHKPLHIPENDKMESAFLPKSKNTFSGLCCIQFVSQEYYTPAILEKQQKILYNAQSYNSFNTPKKGLPRRYTPYPVDFRRCEYKNTPARVSFPVQECFLHFRIVPLRRI